MADTDGCERMSATKFVSPFTYLISAVNSAIKAKCLVCRGDVLVISVHKKNCGLLSYV